MLTKTEKTFVRLFLSGQAMQGLLANPSEATVHTTYIAKLSLDYADALLEEIENRETDGK